MRIRKRRGLVPGFFYCPNFLARRNCIVGLHLLVREPCNEIRVVTVGLAVLVGLVACLTGENGDPPKGYVLKSGEGEDTIGDGSSLIKASPRTGTQRAVFVEAWEPPNSTSGIHVHLEADEFFYVLGGSGQMLVGGEELEITTGDTIFVPVGSDHRITSSGDDPLHVIFIVDRPGLEEQFRLEQKAWTAPR